MNKGASRTRTVTIFLTLLTFFGVGQSSFGFVLFSHREQLPTCEAIISQVQPYSTNHNQDVKWAVKRLVQQIRFAVGEVNDQGTSFSEVHYSGYARKLSNNKARKVIERLNGIEDNLKMDKADLVAFEVRGDAIQEAIQRVQSSEEMSKRSLARLKKFLKSATSHHETTQIFIASSEVTLKDSRLAYVDQIAYFDKKANYEPVWIFVYRPFREPQVGDRKQNSELSELIPARVPVRERKE